MEELLEILNEIDDSIDYENETALIDDQLLDSFAIITLVSELEDAFVIKGLVSLCSALLYRKVGKNSKSRYTAVILGGVADIILVAGGYCLCEYFIYGAGAFASVPANLVQGIGGLILSAVLYPILIAIPDVKQTALANS